jgi:hypothetical protein
MKEYITITAYNSHNASIFIVKSTSLGYKLQSIKAIYHALHQRRKKYILDQMCGFVAQYCGLLTF